MARHALLSPSSAARWTSCPPSARLCEHIEEGPSLFAEEGTEAHALCEYKVKQALGLDAQDPTPTLGFYNELMEDCADGYAVFVLEALQMEKDAGRDPIILLEQKVDISAYVPECSGTADCIIVSDKHLHVIDFKYGPAVATADAIVTFRTVVKRIAMNHGLHATFMPKPVGGINGSGMHTHMSIFKDGKNAFYDPKGDLQLSKAMEYWIGGLLEHASGMVAVTNPTVNSYKRLTPGYEAPTNIAWSTSNRSAMIRVPARRGNSTRAELRMPDPSCNPYLALAVIAGAGMDGLKRKIAPPPAIMRNIYHMSVRDRRRHKIKELPATLREAMGMLRRDKVVAETLGEHVFKQFIEAKTIEYDDYRIAVHGWELDRYLAEY